LSVAAARWKAAICSGVSAAHVCGVESAWHHDKAASRITRLCGYNVFDLIL
jgi:hypothetical protein